MKLIIDFSISIMRNLIEIDAVVFRRISDNVQYLLIKRTEKLGNFWQFVTGGNEGKETLIETLKRELKEELSITENQIKSIIENVHYFEWLTKSNELIKEYCFGVEINSDADIKLSEEHDEFKWCNIEEAIRLLKWDGNRTAVFKLNEILKSHKFF